MILLKVRTTFNVLSVSKCRVSDIRIWYRVLRSCEASFFFNCLSPELFLNLHNNVRKKKNEFMLNNIQYTINRIFTFNS